MYRQHPRADGGSIAATTESLLLAETAAPAAGATAAAATSSSATAAAGVVAVVGVAGGARLADPGAAAGSSSSDDSPAPAPAQPSTTHQHNHHALSPPTAASSQPLPLQNYSSSSLSPSAASASDTASTSTSSSTTTTDAHGYLHQLRQQQKQAPVSEQRKRLSRRLPSWVSRSSTSSVPPIPHHTPSSASRSTSLQQQQQQQLRQERDVEHFLNCNGDTDGAPSSLPRQQSCAPVARGDTASSPPPSIAAGSGGGQPRDGPGRRLHAHASHESLPTAVRPERTQQTRPLALADSAAAAAGAAAAGPNGNGEETSSSGLSVGRDLSKSDRADSGHFSSGSTSLSTAGDSTSTLADAGLNACQQEAAHKRKMHQTSSRLLRMTDDERPFERDFKDLFSTLVVSLPLTQHRVRFQRIDHTFTSDEAITNLGSLKFSQSNRMPDPKDPSRIVTTTTTTTFSMAREMARSVCQKFLEARLVESVDGKNDFASKSAVWQLTPKGMAVLSRFCQRNGINQRHVMDALDSARNQMNLVIVEREADTDKLHRDQATIEVIFRRFAGQDGPNIKNSVALSDSDSLSEYASGMVGVRMARDRKIGDRLFFNTFTGKAAIDWLMDCCTLVDKRETIELASLFCEYGLMQAVEQPATTSTRFSGAKTSIYFVTEKGQRVAGWISSPSTVSDNEDAPRLRENPASRDSNANRMTVIIRDPALRLLFREYLRDTHCEENLAFYLDVNDFLSGYNAAKRSSVTPRFEAIRETLAAAYSLYNAFLAPGSPCELNIDHSLRTALAGRMTRAVGDDDAMIQSLDEVASLFDQAQVSVFKLMASDSVPKFLRKPKYAAILRERNLDAQLGGR